MSMKGPSGLPNDPTEAIVGGILRIAGRVLNTGRGFNLDCVPDLKTDRTRQQNRPGLGRIEGCFTPDPLPNDFVVDHLTRATKRK